MMLDLWMPFWWYNKKTGGMTQTQLKEGRVLGSFEMFRKMIVDNASYYQPDIENIREEKPDEYELFVSQEVKSFMAVPYSRREHGIIFLRNPKRFGGQPDMLRIISNILIQEINEQKHLDRMKINAAASDVRKDADVIVNLFGGIEIMTEQGKLVEAEMKSNTCSKIFALLMPILYSCHPRSRNRLEKSGFKLDPRVIRNEPLGFHDYNKLQMNAYAVVSDSGTLPEESSFFTSVGHPFPAVCIRTSTERPEALDKACFILAGIDENSLLQAVTTAVDMNENGDYGIPVPTYVEENVSTKVVKIIQSYTGVVNKMVWRKF